MDVTGDTIANEVIMTRQTYAGTVFIVEGDKDEKVFRKFAVDREPQIFPAWGKQNVLDAIDILDREQKRGFLAIIDADFSHLDRTYPSSPNVLVTDDHDLEMMIVHSDSFASLTQNLCSKAKLTAFTETTEPVELRKILLSKAIRIGYLRRCSQVANLRLCFQGLKYERFVNKDSLDVNTDTLVEQVLTLTRNKTLNKSELISKINEMIKRNEQDPYQICCGHDFVAILSFGLRKALGTKTKESASCESVETALRLSYDSSCFMATQLYSRAKSWEQKNAPFKTFR